MITADGWIDWAEKLLPTKNNVNPGVNTVKGAFFHSAEGYASVLLDPNSQYGYNGNLSWHASNLMDGRFIQHYPLTARCWHATAANNDYVGVESEGYQPNEKTLTDAQVQNLRRFTADLEQWKGWKRSRTGNASQTLWEHREVVWLGGTGTTCPNGRIPWDKILTPQEGDMNLTPDGKFKIEVENNCIVFYSQGIPVFRIGDDSGPYAGRLSKNFGGQWIYLRNPGDADGKAEAYWSPEPGD